MSNKSQQKKISAQSQPCENWSREELTNRYKETQQELMETKKEYETILDELELHKLKVIAAQNDYIGYKEKYEAEILKRERKERERWRV